MNDSESEFQDEGDEVIAEVRAARHRISARFGHDPYRLVAYYMERQKEYPDRLVRAVDRSDGEEPAAA